MNKQHIDTVVFDLGNVVLSFDPLKYLQKYFKDENMIKILYKEVFKGEEWLHLDRGSMEEEEALESITKRIPEYHEIVKKILSTWNEMLTPIQSTVDMISVLKEQGYRLYILSNFPKRAFGEISKKYEFFQWFDGRLISCDYKLLKPEEEIYKTLVQLYDINPSTTVFIDDSEANVKAAEKLGFHTIHFQKSEQLTDFFLKIE